MENPTGTGERPEWAARILDALHDAYRAGRDGRLTEGERDLLTAIDMRLRHRLGEPGPDGPTGIDLATLAAFLMERGIAQLADEGQS